MTLWVTQLFFCLTGFNQTQSHNVTDGQLTSRQGPSPFWVPRPDIWCCQSLGSFHVEKMRKWIQWIPTKWIPRETSSQYITNWRLWKKLNTTVTLCNQWYKLSSSNFQKKQNINTDYNHTKWRNEFWRIQGSYKKVSHLQNPKFVKCRKILNKVYITYMYT